ncbi:MAG: bifunctional nuclease family protein [Eggerthellaceae bacterium]|nr:bifunctional nuclease family protein [Eggerthellaceae bacterium]
MVEVKVLTLIVTGGGSPSFLVLEPIEEHVSEGKSRVVPICVGGYEALGLGSVLEGTRFTRPMTHDLLLDALTNLDARIDHVFINDVKSGTFYARLVLAQHGRLVDLDARPSDAIALALRQGAPVYIDETVLERASFPYLFKRPYDEERIVDEFKDFLEGISPDDFSTD